MDAIKIGWVLTGLGWFVTAVGWIISNIQANSRETRKEYRLALNNLESTIDRLLTSYRSYLIGSDDSEIEQARLQVHSEMNRLRRQIEWLEPATNGALMKYYAGVYEAITGGDFESKTRNSTSPAINYRSAVTATENLLDKSECWFRDKYH